MADKDKDTKEVPGTPTKKERVLHTRVPAVLDAELKKLASALRVPVSNVVRTILEDAVQTVDAVGKAAEDELRTVAERLRQSRQRSRIGPPPTKDATPTPTSKAPLAGVIGFQPMMVARDSRCGLCDAPLPRSSPAFLAIRSEASTALILCEQCLPFSHRSAASEPMPPKENDHES